MLKAILAFFVILCFHSKGKAQDSATARPWNWNVYIDAYYSYDFNEPADHTKTPVLYNHNRHNEVSINLALASVTYNDSSIRAALGIMAGSYPQYNLSAEPELFRHIFEANVGVRLSRRKELWIDAGILPSHIGTESAISKDCWTLTRSLAAESSPYFETGVRLSYASQNKKWMLAGLILNGWQRITRITGNQTPAFGTQLRYQPNDQTVLSYNTYIGNEASMGMKRRRFFNNLFGVFQLSSRLALTLGVDYGLQQSFQVSDKDQWWAPLLIARYQFGDWAIAGRFEYYKDEQGVILQPVNGAPANPAGWSVNLDRLIHKKVLWRVEGRWLQNKDPYFNRGASLVRTNAFITTNLSVFFP